MNRSVGKKRRRPAFGTFKIAAAAACIAVLGGGVAYAYTHPGFLQEYLGIAPEECMAFGDNYNDKELLESVGFPVAMENAKPEIYAMCQNHTERVERTLRELLAGI